MTQAVNLVNVICRKSDSFGELRRVVGHGVFVLRPAISAVRTNLFQEVCGGNLNGERESGKSGLKE